MKEPRKEEIISFKVSEALAAALGGVPNRSEFIRSAVLAALDGACPLCKGTGILTPEQRLHWAKFIKTHSIEKCDECDAVYLACGAEPKRRAHR